jgi:hypothetical protein
MKENTTVDIEVYSRESTVIERPESYTVGVKVGWTAPAKWWNWLFNACTARLKELYNTVTSMHNEIKNAVGGTLDPDSDTQLKGKLDKIQSDIADDIASVSADLKEFKETKGKAGGLASLGADSRIPYSQLPESAMEFKGNWNASTNTPTLADGAGNLGDMYIVSTSGTQDLGGGSVSYLSGDQVIYNQDNRWEKISGGAVKTVEGTAPDSTGNVSLPVANQDKKGIVKQGILRQFGLNNFLLNYGTADDVTYGNGMFVAVGSNGIILTSTDGISWTKQTSPDFSELKSITYSNSMFVAVGLSGTILTSTDGISWADQKSPAYVSLYGITYGNGMFVAVGVSGTIFTSTDGISWTKQTSPTAASLDGITYGNGMFVAVGYSGTIIVYVYTITNAVAIDAEGNMTVPVIDELIKRIEALEAKI